MGAPDLLQHLRTAGFTLSIHGERLLVAPAGSLTTELREAIRANKEVLVAALQAPPERQSANPLLTVDQSDECHTPHWSDAELHAFSQRRTRLLRWGCGESEADDLAERMTLRDRQGDDRRMCLECSNLGDTGRCIAAASGRIAGADRRVEPVRNILQRCEAFGLRKGLA
jgi:hypothetical protein